MNFERLNYTRVRNRAKELLGIQEGPPVDVARVAQEIGAEVRYFDLEDDVSGILYRDGDQKVIVVNERHPVSRQRFTIAHEIGHLVLHRGVPVHVDQSFRINLRDPLSARGEEIEEMEANAFAANLLMPLHWLRRELRLGLIDADDAREVAALADRYQVSHQAMLIRITSVLRPPDAGTKIE